ncbi:hypothetical protein SDC9_65330 [bioreactor metagenome]|uniref:O-antigen ligase-related domain-containing protein n=1 Tax=bioreactor metagenome TaxID=1076179 RepID=A0A644XRP8_9ZZZZ
MFIFIIPQFSLEYWGSGKYFFGIILILYSLQFILRKKWLINGKTLIFIYLFILYALISILFSDSNEKGIWLFRLLTLFLVAISFSMYFNSLKNIFDFFKVYYLGTIFASLQIIYFYYYSSQNFIVESRANIFGIDSNESSIILCFGLITGLYLYNKNKNKILFISQLLIVYAVVLTYSRTGFISLIFVTIYYAWSQLKGLKRYAVIFLFILGFIVVSPYLYQFWHNVGFQFYTSTGKLDLSGRDLIWSTGLNIFKDSDKILFGFGIDSFSFELDKKLFGANAHNVFLKVLFELGIIGIFFFLLLLINILSNIYLLRKYDKITVLLFLVLLFSFMTLSWIYTINVWIFIVLLQRYSTLELQNNLRKKVKLHY